MLMCKHNFCVDYVAWHAMRTKGSTKIIYISNVTVGLNTIKYNVSVEYNEITALMHQATSPQADMPPK